MPSMLTALGFGFDPLKFKPQLNMAIQRFKMQVQKKAEEIQRDRREISTLLSAKKFESARIRAEAVYRRQREIEGYEIVQLMAELVFERTPQLTSAECVPDDLRQAVATIAWAAPRVSFQELDKAVAMLKSKFGSDALEELRDNEHNVHPRVVERLTITVPPTAPLRALLIDVATKNSLLFTPEENARFLEVIGGELPVGYTREDVARASDSKCPDCVPGVGAPVGVPVAFPAGLPSGVYVGMVPSFPGPVYGGPPPAYAPPSGPPSAYVPPSGPPPPAFAPLAGPPAVPFTPPHAASPAIPALPPPPTHLPGGSPVTVSPAPAPAPGGLDFEALNRRFAELKHQPPE